MGRCFEHFPGEVRVYLWGCLFHIFAGGILGFVMGRHFMQFHGELFCTFLQGGISGFLAGILDFLFRAISVIFAGISFGHFC